MAMNAVGSVQFRGKTSVEQLYEAMWIDEAAYAELRALFPEKKSAEPQEDFTGGRYVIQTELGRGAMGVVYKAYDRVIGRTVALKTIPLEVEESERVPLVQRLKKEAQTAGALDHPGIVTVFDAGDEAGVFYFTMQYVDGRPLSDLRARRELLPLEKIYDICEQMLSAMGAAHAAGVIHRDLKPSNMMLTPKGQLKIMDFGIAKFGDSGLTKAGMVLGTPSYLAPEQAAGRRIDHRADVFSLGAIAYEMFTGERAFPGESTTSIIYKVMNDEPIPPRAIEPSLSPSIDAVIRKALAKDPLQRFKSCEEFLHALRESRTNPDTVIDAPIRQAPIPATVQTAQRTVVTGAAAAVAPARTSMMTQPIAAQAAVDRQSSKIGLYVGAAIVVAALGLGGYFAMSKKQPPPTVPATIALQPGMTEPAAQTSSQAPPELHSAVANGAAPKTETNPQTPSSEQPLTRREKRREKIRDAIAANTATQPAPTSAANEGSNAAPSSMWTREDIPDLLKKADVYSGRGEYGRAILTYREILRIDGSNAAAREGLQKAKEAQQLRR
jgi:serine/threonine-protein kinase